MKGKIKISISTYNALVNCVQLYNGILHSDSNYIFKSVFHDMGNDYNMILGDYDRK